MVYLLTYTIEAWSTQFWPSVKFILSWSWTRSFWQINPALFDRLDKHTPDKVFVKFSNYSQVNTLTVVLKYTIVHNNFILPFWGRHTVFVLSLHHKNLYMQLPLHLKWYFLKTLHGCLSSYEELYIYKILPWRVAFNDKSKH